EGTMTGVDPQNLFTVRFFWFKVDSLIVTISYLLGSVPFGYLVAKFRGIDIRQQGSGNIGATNVMRVLGKGPGYTVFACDALKGLAAVLIGSHIASTHSMSFSQVRDVFNGVGHGIYHTNYIVRLPESVGA